MTAVIIIVTVCILIFWLILVLGRDKGMLIKILQILLGVGAVFFAFLNTFDAIKVPDDNEIAVLCTIIICGAFLGGNFLAKYYLSQSPRNLNKMINILLFIIVILILFLGSTIFSLRYNSDTNPLSIILILCFIILCIGLCVGAFVSLVRYQINIRITAAETKASTSDAELKLLQSQLSPHFLFNTLNNLYALSLHDTSKVPPLLLKLSDLLRYTVYDTKNHIVPLTDEIDYIKNYIDFEKIRLGERLELTENWPNNLNEAPQIVPMLLIVFVENAFKHSKNTQDLHIKIDIDLQIWGKTILFSVQNSFSPNQSQNPAEQSGGLGLANVKKRLKLVYPMQHDLQIETNKNTFTVKLRLT